MNEIERSMFLLLIAFSSINRHPLDRKNAPEHAVKKWNPVFHKKACDNNKIRA
jgi:hypothetical protein